MPFSGFRIGVIAQDSDVGLKSLYCGAGTDNHYDCFNNAGDVNYQVPVGKKLVIVNILYYVGTANSAFYIGYGDNAKDDDAAAPTNLMYITSSFKTATANKMYSLDVYCEVPAGKYPHLKINKANSYFNIFAKEVTV